MHVFFSPCRNFQQAVNVVDPGGEVTAIDSTGFGPISISKSVTITSPDGVEAGIVPVSSGNAIAISAGSSDAVELHGLTVDGSGVGNNGIEFTSGASLTVVNCVVRNMTLDGIFLNATTTQTLAVSNSYFNDNGNFGIFISSASSGNITASIDRTAFFHNRIGLTVVSQSGATGSPAVAVTDSIAANNFTTGFLVESVGGQVTNLSLTHSLTEGNGTGVEASGTNATLWLAQSTVTGNVTAGFNNSGGVINTFQDNYFTANGPNTGSSTNVGKL